MPKRKKSMDDIIKQTQRLRSSASERGQSARWEERIKAAGNNTINQRTQKGRLTKTGLFHNVWMPDFFKKRPLHTPPSYPRSSSDESPKNTVGAPTMGDKPSWTRAVKDKYSTSAKGSNAG